MQKTYYNRPIYFHCQSKSACAELHERTRATGTTHSATLNMESRDPVTRVTKNSEVSEMSLDRGSRTLDVTCIQRQIPFQLLCKHLPFNVISMNSNA